MSPQVLPPDEGAQPSAASQQARQAQQAQQPASSPSRVLEVLDGFLGVQQQRAAAYRRLDAAFRAYLANSAEGPYR